MEIIKWRDTFETGIEQMDEQHRRLIHLINQLYDILKTKAGYDAIDAILQEMADYAEHHLRDEEQLLAEHGYPGLEQHRQVHQSYFSRMDELLEAMNRDRQTATQQVYVFLRQWWINHIVEEDKRYGEYLRGKGVR